VILTTLITNDTDFAPKERLFETLKAQMPQLICDDFSFTDFNGNVICGLLGFVARDQIILRS